MSKTKLYLAITLLAVILLNGCSLERIATQQEKATGLWSELICGETFGQTFVSERDNLYRIDLSTATFARTNSALVIFHLKEAPGSATDIRSIALPGSAIQNERTTTFLFSPLPDSAGKSFYFSIESPEARPGNAITVYANNYDQYSGGTAYRNGAPVAGDLAFSAYSQDTFTLSSIMSDIASRTAKDPTFFIFYGLFLLVVILGFIVALRKKA